MEHGGERDGGFTLIELMMVVLIIAILLAMAIPTYVGARDRANDRATMSNVRTAFGAARVYYTDKLAYTADPVAMRQVEPAIVWTNTPLDGAEPAASVYIETQDVPSAKQSVIVVGRSKTGKCYFLRDVMEGGTTGTYFDIDVSAGTTCTPPPATATVWTNHWS
jgi:type IV pilus assembly protein PilA